MFGFLARECGWDYKYVVKNLSLSQIKRYYESIHKLKQVEWAKNLEGMFHAVAAAHGNIKVDVFNEYILTNIGQKEKFKSNINNIINEMKQSGFEIEDK